MRGKAREGVAVASAIFGRSRAPSPGPLMPCMAHSWSASLTESSTMASISASDVGRPTPSNLDGSCAKSARSIRRSRATCAPQRDTLMPRYVRADVYTPSGVHVLSHADGLAGGVFFLPRT